jgi:hypothetical protein
MAVHDVSCDWVRQGAAAWSPTWAQTTYQAPDVEQYVNAYVEIVCDDLRTSGPSVVVRVFTRANEDPREE